jgi:GDP-mannose 6-dehydrogenase
MKIAIFGLGYVGCVSAGCLSQKGHTIYGVDVDTNKVNLVNSGKATIIEDGLDELIAEGVKIGNITATTDAEWAVLNSDVGIICVGTPNTANGHLNMEYITKISEQIAVALQKKEDFYTITIRSTVMPGTNQEICNLISSISNKENDKGFAVVSNPEFLREGNAIVDFFNPPYTVVGSTSPKGIEKTKEMFSFLDAPVKVVGVEVAEMIKFLNNSFHALKVAFANEIGRLCKSLNVDSHELMELFIGDTQLNISHRYLKPGLSYGGSCLPKDLRALNILAHDKYVSIPVLKSVAESNITHNNYIFDLISTKKVHKIGIVGLSFKENTDDLRFSPSLELCENLVGKGYAIKIYDQNINLSRLVGKNKDFLFSHLPHINVLLINEVDDFLQDCDLIVFAQRSNHVLEQLDRIKKDTIILDLVNIDKLKAFENYEGLCW